MDQSRNSLDALIELYDDAFDREAWHGPTLFKVLEGISPEEASWRPEHQVHNIWELVLHILGWERYSLRYLRGEKVEPLGPEQDFPKIEKADLQSWQETIERLRMGHAELRAEMKKVTNENLFAPPPSQQWTRYAHLQGIINHLVYHTGQISYIRRLKAYDPNEFIG